jgi:hypothetical protein
VIRNAKTSTTTTIFDLSYVARSAFVTRPKLLCCVLPNLLVLRAKLLPGGWVRKALLAVSDFPRIRAYAGNFSRFKKNALSKRKLPNLSFPRMRESSASPGDGFLPSQE